MFDIGNRTADAWGDFIEEHIQAGWSPFLLTFMFEPLAGNQAAKMAQMAQLLEVAYGIFVTRVIRKPRTAAIRGMLPVWLCSPDLPVYKRYKKASLRDLKLNDGLHYHATLLLPPWSRIDDVEMHFEDLRPIYLRRAFLDRVDVEPIVSRVRYVQGYGYKSILRGHFHVGDHFALPKSLHELASRQQKKEGSSPPPQCSC